ncbi:c-Myc-binding protein homolog [Sitodiplosis mosellana]|uniref:c-Myc-binding protein homolog n=1 Tax=Sitodiplosis mosellana TaxID=263140 RepID=UPI00244388E6|nr:c-Myc-binding protein homolog [Sitodiplosis mosellana]
MSYREIDCKRDQFRKYIESKGVVDSITKVLIKLLETPEKPEHPMDFIRQNLGASQAEERRIESLEQEVIGYKKEVEDLKSQLEAVKAKLGEYEKNTDDAVGETKNEEKPTNESVQASEAKASEINQTNGGEAVVDASKDKTSTESETAATPSSTTTTVDSGKTTNDSENADVAKSNTTTAKIDDDKPPASTANEADKTKTSENAATAAVVVTDDAAAVTAVAAAPAAENEK